MSSREEAPPHHRTKGSAVMLDVMAHVGTRPSCKPSVLLVTLGLAYLHTKFQRYGEGAERKGPVSLC